LHRLLCVREFRRRVEPTVAIVALPLPLGFGIPSGLGAETGLAAADVAVVAGVSAVAFGEFNLKMSGPRGVDGGRSAEVRRHVENERNRISMGVQAAMSQAQGASARAPDTGTPWPRTAPPSPSSSSPPGSGALTASSQA